MTYEAHFKACRNMSTKVIRAAKQNFYLNKLNIEADNSKKHVENDRYHTWQEKNTNYHLLLCTTTPQLMILRL